MLLKEDAIDDHREQLEVFHLRVLDDVIHGPELQRLDCNLLVPLPGNHDRRRELSLLGELADNVDTAQKRHIVIDQKEIIGSRGEFGKPLFSVRGCFDHVSPALETLLQKAREAGVVFHIEYARETDINH